MLSYVFFETEDAIPIIPDAVIEKSSHVIVYYDISTGNLYCSNGQFFGNSVLTSYLNNDFILEIHYVEEVNTSANPQEWKKWYALGHKKILSTLAFDKDYKHSFIGIVSSSASIASTQLSVRLSNTNESGVSNKGRLFINPYGDTDNEIIVSYSSYTYDEESDVYTFTISEVNGLPINVSSGTLVRISTPLLFSVDSNTIYEANIPNEYDKGVFYLPVSVKSYRLLNEFDSTGVSYISGILEHNIYIKKDKIIGLSVSGYSNALVRNNEYDKYASDDGGETSTFFCYWSNGTVSYYTKGNEITNGNALYNIDGDIATLQNITADPVIDTDTVLFRTFAIPFVVRNLLDYNSLYTVPFEETDWSTNYIVSVVKNNIGQISGGTSSYSFNTNEFYVGAVISIKEISQDKISGLLTSLAEKQDVLTSDNAGYGISIEDGVISVSDDVGGGVVYNFSNEFTVTGGTAVSINSIEQSKISGLSDSLSAKQDKLTQALNAGTGISISNTGVISGSTATTSSYGIVQFATDYDIEASNSANPGGAAQAYAVKAYVESKIENASVFPIYTNLGSINRLYEGGTNIEKNTYYTASSSGYVYVEEDANTKININGATLSGAHLYPVRANTVFRVENSTASVIFARFDGEAVEYSLAPIVTASPSSRTSSTVSLVVEWNEDTVQSLYRIGETGSWEIYSGTITNISENATYYFKAIDINGRDAISSYTIDYIVPTAPIVTSNTTAQTSDSIMLSIAWGSGSSVKEYKYGNDDWKTCSNNVTASANGTYSFRSKKANGEYYSNVTNYTVSNLLAPVVSLTGYNNTTPTETTNITASTRTGVTIQWRKGSSGSWTNYTSPVLVTSNGTYAFRATDAAGSQGTNSVTFTNIADLTPPVLTLHYDNQTPDISGDILTAETNEPATIYYKKESDSDWTSYDETEPFSLTVTKNATYYFKATDVAGNTCETQTVIYENIAGGHVTPSDGEQDPED